MPMRNTVILLLTLLQLVSCKNEQAGVSGIPFKTTDSSDWGIMGTDGRLLTANTFSRQPSVVINSRFTLPDDKGNRQLYEASATPQPVSPKHFTQIGHFFEEVTIAQKETDSPLLLINKKGETVAKLANYQGYTLLMAHNFSEGRALVYTAAQKYGYIDTRGKMVIKPSYDCAYDFSDGLAIVGLADEQGRMAYQAINPQGEVVFHISLQNNRINGEFSEERLLCKDLNQNYCSYLDKSGKTVLYLPDNILESTNFTHEAAIILSAGGIGVINKSGKILIPANYENGRVVAPGRIALKSRNKWALFDFEGKPLSEFIYDRIYDFYPGGNTVIYMDSLYLLINDKGQAVNDKKYAQVGIDETAARKIPQVFTRHAPVMEDTIPAAAPDESLWQTSKPIENSDRGRNNPFYREAQKVISGQLPEEDAHNRRIILDYMEHFRQSYATRDIDFLEQLFSEDALIIVGKVVKKAPRQGPRYLSSEQVVYNLKSKREYLNRLRAVFKANKQIEVDFKEFNIKKHPTQKGIYGVTVKQHYASDLYSDEGYLFLLWDFRDKTAPQIHVRTWQPGMLDNNTPLPEQEIFSIRNFNLE